MKIKYILAANVTDKKLSRMDTIIHNIIVEHVVLKVHFNPEIFILMKKDNSSAASSVWRQMNYARSSSDIVIRVRILVAFKQSHSLSCDSR